MSLTEITDAVGPGGQPLAVSSVPLVYTTNRLSSEAPVVRCSAEKLRLSRRADRKKASSLLFYSEALPKVVMRRPGEPDEFSPQTKLSSRLADCERAVYGTAELQCNEKTRAWRVRGVKRCGSVWCCAVCSPMIASRRKGELDTMMSVSRNAGYSVVMLTLTARHNREMRLAAFLGALKNAKKALRQRKEWRAFAERLFGSVSVTEVTYGLGHGWHPHFHEMLSVRLPPKEALAALEVMRAIWLTCLRRFGLDGNEAAFQVQDASAAGTYVAKFGAAEELALGGVKRGRKGSRTPWQLLSASRDGDRRAGALWTEFAQAFCGRRQMVWSRGFKEKCGLADVSDNDLADGGEVEGIEEPDDWKSIRMWSPRTWVDARRRIVAILCAAERGEDLDEAEFGPTDAERFAAMLAVESGERRWAKRRGGG